MTTLYHALAAAKDELRRAKDHEQTMKAIVEVGVLSTGRSADDRKRELAVVVAKDAGYRKALEELREAEATVDQAQADLDQAESDRRDHEWRVRARLAEALHGQHEDIVPDWLADKQGFRR